MQELILEEKTTLSPVMKEIYRRLRTNLEFTGIENKVICLTSCMENDGKSSVSFNLAKILAENDKRVLFIDADMRNSVLTKRTGIPDDLKGLSHYLAGKNAASEVIYATNYKNFYVIPTGRFPKNPTELLNKPAYEVLIEGMKQTFDYVIIDTPPLGSVVDAALIAKTADASVLVISANAVSRRMAKTMIDQIVSASHRNAGSPVRMEAELSAVPDKMEMDTFCGELSAAADIHQMPCEISSGYLYVDNRIAPTAQVEVLEYNIYGTKYYEIRNDGFEFKYLEIQQFEIENLFFGYELSVYSNVADRLYWFNMISEIVNASTIIIKFGAADEERILRMAIPGAGSSFDRIREETAVWKEQMERIVKIENYYGVKFYLPKKADESVYVTIEILSDAIEGLPARRLPVVNMKSRGLFKHFTLKEEVWYGDGSDLMSLNLFGYTFKPVAEYIMPGEFVWNRKEHGWESDKKNGGVSVRVEFMVDTDISKDKKLMDVMPVSDLKDELNLEETPIVTGECADIISDYINVSHKVQEIYRQYQIYQEALGEWIHYDLDEDNHLVKKYSGAVIDKVTVNKMTKNILHEGMLLVRKAGAFVQKLGLQNETDFLADSMGDNLGFEFMVLAAIYMDHGHWAVEFENGDSFYNLLEMCTVLRTADEEDSADLLKTFTLLKNEMEEQGMDIRHIDHYNMLRNYIYTVADIYKIFFDAIQKKLEAMVVEIDSLVDKNPDFIATEGKFKGCIFYQTDTDLNRVDVFDPSGNIMADFSIFQNEAIRNYEKTRLGIQGAVEHN